MISEDFFKSQPNTPKTNCGHSFDFREGEDGRCVYCGKSSQKPVIAPYEDRTT